MMFAENLKGRDGRFDHRNVAGSEDNAEDSKDIRGIEREVSRGLLDQGGENLECNLDISSQTVSHHPTQQGLSLQLPDIPYPLAPHIARRLLLQECANLLDLATPRRGIVQEVAQLAGVGLDINGALDCSRVAFQDQDLVLGATLLLDGLHWSLSGPRGSAFRAARERR